MAIRLFRVSVFTATSAAALGVFALVHAAPLAHHHAARPAFDVAAMDRRGPTDNLADDAAAAGETGHARPEAPEPYRSLPPGQGDAIGAVIAAPPPTADAPFDLPYPSSEAVRPVRRHHLAAHHIARRAPPHAPATKPAPRAAPAQPHRLHIVVQPPGRPLLLPSQAPPPVDSTLPEVQAARPQIADLDARLADLTQIAAADMSGADFELSADLAAGREGAVVVRLPQRLLSDLEAEAQDSGFDLDAHPLSVTVALSAQGYDVTPRQTLTSEIQPGHAAAFSWTVRPTGTSGGALSATLTASLQADGEPVSTPLGVLTAQVPAPPPALAEAAGSAAPAPLPAPEPTPELGERLRARLAHMGLGHFRLHDLAIPGRPTLTVPLLGEVASEKVVAAGLLLLALLFLRSLLRSSSLRAERRRRFEAFDRDYFGHEAH